MARKFLYGILFILILATQFAFSDNLYNGVINAKQLWFYGTSALTILVFVLDMLLGRKRISFNINLIDIFLLGFYIYFLIRSINTPYTPLLCNTKFLNYTLLIILYIIIRYAFLDAHFWEDQHTRNALEKSNPPPAISNTDILILFLILSGLVQATWGLLQLYGFTRSFHSGFKITGTFFNPAPYALYLAVIYPLGVGYLLTDKDQGVNKIKTKNFENENIVGSKISKTSSFLFMIFKSLIPSFLIIKLKYHISLLTVIAITLVLPATMNRASWLGVVAGTLVIIAYRYDLWRRTVMYLNTRIRKLYAVTTILSLMFLMGAGIYFLKKGSSDGRLLIWEVTISNIFEKPLFGHGVGRFEAEYNNWQAEYFRSHPEQMDMTKGIVAGNTKYCFNEYLEMAAELGSLGLLFFVGLIISIFIKGFNTPKSKHNTPDKRNDIRMTFANHRTNDNRMATKISDSDQPNNDNSSFILLVASLTSIFVCAIFSFPFYSLPTLIVFFLLLGMFSSQIMGINVLNVLMKKLVTGFMFSPKASLTYPVFSPLIKFATIVTFTLISVFLFLKVNKQYKALKSWDESVMLYQAEAYGEACKSFSENYTMMKYNGGYLLYYGKSLYMNEDYVQSIGMLERASFYTSDEILYTSMGDTYKALKKFPKAETAYKNAMLIVPHKLYPRYLLANLYNETGQKEKALSIAEEIIDRKIKVESTATEEINEAMRKLIKRIKNHEDF